MVQRFVAEPLLLVWIVLIVLYGFYYLKHDNLKYIVILGITTGLAVLTKAQALGYPVFLVIWFVWKKGLSRKLLAHSILL